MRDQRTTSHRVPTGVVPLVLRLREKLQQNITDCGKLVQVYHQQSKSIGRSSHFHPAEAGVEENRLAEEYMYGGHYLV